MSILNKLTEGIVNRDLSRDGDALLNKWEKTGLLEGLDDYSRNTMSVLLENQAKELLRESNTMQGGDVEGFAAVAFPIVRRVFGGLLAQKLVSVQPMSLPSGLIFFMDFVKQGPNAATTGSDYNGAPANQQRGEMNVQNDTATASEPSVYGGQVKGRGILTSGAELDPEARGAVGAGNQAPTPQFQDLIQGFSTARAQGAPDNGECVLARDEIVLDGSLSDEEAQAVQFDPDLMARSGSERVRIVRITRTNFNAMPAGTGGTGQATCGARMSGPDIRHLAVQAADGSTLRGVSDVAAAAGDNVAQVRRLTRLVTGDGSTRVYSHMNDAGVEYVEFVIVGIADADGSSFSTVGACNQGNEAMDGLGLEFALADNIAEATGATTPNPDTLGALVGQTAWEMEGSVDLPEISIKVDSVAVTSVTRKLKASWSPELAQDLNAYHNLDAEVELTGILSEQIALEIDQEILADLIAGAKASSLYWSRRPGLFVNRKTGADATSLAAPPDFTGSVSEWYETLVETINDVSADIHRKTLRGGANFLVCGPEVANILEFTSGFRASVTHDDDSGSVGAQQVGSISKKWDLYVDPYFPRNIVLVGRKGSSFLESGYVYAPYVPLQTTPTIFHADDFTPRKAVMTRYGKKLVRPDMYGLVVVRDLEG